MSKVQEQFAKLKGVVKANPKRSMLAGGIALVAGIAIAAVTSNPAKYGMMVSNNGSGNAGTWVTVTGTGGTPYSGSVTPAGLMVSTDGSGNPGTWVAATPTTFAGVPTGAACVSGTVFPCVAATVPLTTLTGTGGLGNQTLVSNTPTAGFYCWEFYMATTVAGTAGTAYGVIAYVGPTPSGYAPARASGSLGAISLTSVGADTATLANGTNNVCFYAVAGQGIVFYITYSSATGTPQIVYAGALTRLF